jgi:Mrp family chromosome partitioning ATPase/capsular polysaccharide biosynthesis protein
MAQRIDSSDALPRSGGRRAGEEPIEVRRHLDAIRRARWLIAGIVALLTIVVVVVSASLPNRYKATASIVKNVDTDPLASTDVNVVTRELATTDRLLTTTDVLAAAARQVPGETEKSLQDSVSSTVDPDANLIFVTATAGTAARAAQIANAVAQTFVNSQAQIERRQLTAARASLLQEEARIGNQPGAAAQRQAIEQRLSELGVSLAAAGTDLTIAQRANVPDGPASPKPVRNGIIAAFLGLFIGILVALGRDQLVPRVSSQRELSRLIDLPLLASVPYVNRRFGLRPRLPSGIEYETYQSLAASMRFALPPGDEPRLVLVTSALHAEGKSTVTARLGEALAQSGQPTLLVSADLRWPTLHEILDTPVAPGLTDILQSVEADTPAEEVHRQISELIVPVHDQSRRGTLHLLPSGHKVAEPARLLTGAGMDAVGDALLDLDYGYVLVDSAPILGIADSLALARALHHVLFVARLDRLTLDTVYDVREVLDRLETEPIGMVVLGARGEASPYYLTAARPALDDG